VVGTSSGMTGAIGLQRRADQGRRDEVATATFNVIARVGLDRTSIREIAQEMKVSTGVLTYHFRNKEELLDFVFDSVVEILAGNGHFGVFETVDAFKESFLAIMPTTEERRQWWKVWLAFATGSYSRPSQRRHLEELSGRIIAAWKASLDHLVNAGELHPDLDLDREVATLGYLFDGMGTSGVRAPELGATAEQRRVLDAYFSRLTR
jgi:AcrR family transcriptional regulator